MSEAQYFKFALALPLLAPALSWLLQGFGLRDPTPITSLLVASLLIGGIPYAICAWLGLAWLRGRSAAEHRRLAVLGPIIFVPFLAAWIFLSESLGRTSWEILEFGGVVGISAILALGGCPRITYAVC